MYVKSPLVFIDLKMEGGTGPPCAALYVPAKQHISSQRHQIYPVPTPLPYDFAVETGAIQRCTTLQQHRRELASPRTLPFMNSTALFILPCLVYTLLTKYRLGISLKNQAQFKDHTTVFITRP